MKMLKNLNTLFLGKELYYYKSIDSTQKEIWRRVKKQDIKNGTTIIAEIQTQGTGTHGRRWYTNTNNNIAFSFFIKTNCTIDDITGITVEIAKTIVKVFKKIYNIELKIKHPNDIMYNNKKIGGILTETKIYKNKPKCLVVGIGINTNQEEFGIEIKDIATSIKNEFKIDIENELIISEFCNLFEKTLIQKHIMDLE